MASIATKIAEDKATITLPPAIGKLIEKGGEAVINVGNFTIRIAPKAALGKRELRKFTREDTRIWRKIEATYRGIRSEVTRERYPYLYGR